MEVSSGVSSNKIIKAELWDLWNLEGVLHILSLCATMQLFGNFWEMGNFLYQFDRPGVKANSGKPTWIFRKLHTK